MRASLGGVWAARYRVGDLGERGVVAGEVYRVGWLGEQEVWWRERYIG